MKVSVSKRTNSLEVDSLENIRGRIYFALSRFSPRIEQVTVETSAVVGARGSSQRLCRLSVRMAGLGSFSMEAVEDEVMIAVSRVAERAAQRVQRILDRHRDETR